MPRFKLMIAYDGATFHGWQRQPNQATVQGAIEAAMTQMNNRLPMVIAGASRTDAGVHAEGQCAIFDYEGHIDTRGWHRGLNALTSDAITIRSVEPVDDAFHPRFHSIGKHYRYLLWQGCAIAPRWRPWCWSFFQRLDIEAMREASRHLLGEHDFVSFRASDCQSKSTRRRIDHIEISLPPRGWEYPRPDEEDALIAIDYRGNAFLKYMIRIITGTLVEVGQGQRSPQSVADAIAARSRSSAGRTGPPHGLSLIEVFYDPALRGPDAVAPSA